ncbi:MAG TPA: PAS domain S-box protein, partial [Polyangiaceae bacterium]|nr:PAS domain S-box protein [Polyangiaceae bacterium]
MNLAAEIWTSGMEKNVAFLNIDREDAAAALTAPADGHHLVHFYENEASLFEIVCKFLGAGLDAGDRLIVIATAAHRSGMLRQLRDRHVERAIANGQLLLLDARETLARFMVNGCPDADRFHRVLQEALTRVGAGLSGVRVRAYGEMVDLLWRDGNRSAAIALEELWNEAGSRHAFSLLCAYVMANFYKSGGASGFTDVCRTHSHVLSAESIAEAHASPPEVDELEIHRLRKRLRSAELETEQRREVERALRESSLEQRRAAQEALLASEARFHQLVDAITDYAIFLLDSGGHVTTWNPGAQKIKGYTQEEILGRHFSVFYTAEDRAARKPERILETVRREGHYEEESWRVRKDGSQFWANVVITALRDQKGELAGFAKVTRDLTAKREAEEKARELAREQIARAASEKASHQLARLNRVGALFIAEPSRFETVLLEIVDAAIDIAAADFGNIQLLGPEGAELRIAAQRGFPQWWLDFWNRTSAGQGSCGTALERGERVVIEDVEESSIFAGTPALEVQRRAGVRAVVSIPIVSRSGRSIGIFSTHYRSPQRPDDQTLQMLDMLARQAADIIDRARSEQASELVRHELEQASRAKDEFLATASHELRTPLNAMLGWATILRRDHHDPVKLERGLQVIERNVKAQTRIVSDLLDVSRIISGKLCLSLKKTPVSAVIHAAADVVRSAADAKRVALVLDLEPDVGLTIADPDRLQQIVWNLLVNAVRFTPGG